MQRGKTALLCAVLRSVRLFRTAPDYAARQIEAEGVLRLLQAAEGVPRLTVSIGGHSCFSLICTLPG